MLKAVCLNAPTIESSYCSSAAPYTYEMIFKRTVEDFVCEHCGASMSGSGYTNHCNVCLWSKHVDVHPGDRAEPCRGMMKPVRLEGTTPLYDIVHVCEKCALERRNKAAPDDSVEALVALARRT